MTRNARKPYVHMRSCLECGDPCVGVRCAGCAAIHLLKRSSRPSSTMPDAAPKPVWHTCALSQPPKFGWYAVADALGRVYAARWSDNPYASSERARKPRWIGANGRIDTNVAYWHPMPPPPALEVQA